MSYESMGSCPGTTLDEAKNWLRERVRDGAKCPCCSQLAKIYKRKLNSAMAYALILIYRYFRLPEHEEWMDVTDYLLSSHRVSAANSNAALLRLWGLIEAKDGEREDGSSRIGLYKITDLGREFVEGTAAVSRYVYLYDGRLLKSEDDETTTIQDALGDKFSYSDLMAS